ncbi:hypothetical protein ASPTUDRAFT_40736 [Aspergillus tubingensis CBS 134.48]|uniref:Uncharacterized protein n=1 Tax=Aspergillus tubingensis (strain CBS 134.48) TaxID=767770 RepID=A0A1L9N613_ASPTC|nr:hypothetical protein ASPTUDRAFT_40736 [Aspergillus tubingensis CBS 134.48]
MPESISRQMQLQEVYWEDRKYELRSAVTEGLKSTGRYWGRGTSLVWLGAPCFLLIMGQAADPGSLSRDSRKSLLPLT